MPEKDLPVKLPFVKKYEPSKTGESPLAAITEWVNTKCPKCGGPAKRETDTMPNWAGSSWYFLRYIDPKNKNLSLISKNYNIGRQLIYTTGEWNTPLSIFYIPVFGINFYMTLNWFRLPNLTRLGVPTVWFWPKMGEKMSKSFGNVINPDEIVKNFGADTLRMYEMFMGPFDQMISWNTQGVVGLFRFLNRNLAT